MRPQCFAALVVLLLAYPELTKPSDGILTRREFRQWTFVDTMALRHRLLAACHSRESTEIL